MYVPYLNPRHRKWLLWLRQSLISWLTSTRLTIHPVLYSYNILSKVTNLPRDTIRNLYVAFTFNRVINLFNNKCLCGFKIRILSFIASEISSEAKRNFTNTHLLCNQTSLVHSQICYKSCLRTAVGFSVFYKLFIITILLYIWICCYTIKAFSILPVAIAILSNSHPKTEYRVTYMDQQFRSEYKKYSKMRVKIRKHNKLCCTAQPAEVCNSSWLTPLWERKSLCSSLRHWSYIKALTWYTRMLFWNSQRCTAACWF